MIAAVASVLMLSLSAGNAVEWRIDASTCSVVAEGRTVLRYRYADVPYKPCVDLLATPAGINVLRDAPADHLHHHALMYAVKLNGVNFWEEKEAPGRQSHEAFTEVGVWAGERPHAEVEEILTWAPGESAPLVRETRWILLHAEADLPATLITWTAELCAADPGVPVELTGAHYHGLGMRFVESMDQGGKLITETSAPGEPVRGTELLFQGRWCAYQAEAEGKPVTVAMFDAPANPRPATWFTMTGPFAYLSATLESHRVPQTLGTLNLKYGVAVWDGHVSREEIEAVYARWLELTSAGAAPQGNN